MRPHPLFLVLLAALAGLAPAQSSYTHREAQQGDLSDDGAAPTQLPFYPATTTVVATQQGNAAGRDIDYFRIIVPAGFALLEVRIVDYVSAAGNDAFLGLQAGAAVTVDPNAPNPAPLLGGVVYGAADVGTDVLPRAGTLAGAMGFTPPLPSGEYSFWLNQTDAPSTVTLDLHLGTTGLGAEYCQAATPNSTGVHGGLEGLGSASLAANAFRLRAFDLPQHAFGYCLASRQAGYAFGVTGGGRVLCVSGLIGRYDSQVRNTGSAGEMTTLIDLTVLPQPNGAVAALAGETWCFQVWHRDTQSGFAWSQFTKAWAVTFAP